jgi:hypothetical protein
MSESDIRENGSRMSLPLMRATGLGQRILHRVREAAKSGQYGPFNIEEKEVRR